MRWGCLVRLRLFDVMTVGRGGYDWVAGWGSCAWRHKLRLGMSAFPKWEPMGLGVDWSGGVTFPGPFQWSIKDSFS